MVAVGNDDEVELEYSPLCGEVTRDGLKVLVQIYRIAGRDEGAAFAWGKAAKRKPPLYSQPDQIT